MNTESNFKFLLVISLVLSLALGATAGYFAPHRPCWGQHGGPGKMKKMMLRNLSRQLSLTNDQRQQLEAVFKSKETKMKALHEELRPKFEAVRDETRAEIRVFLTPEQILKFDAMNAKEDARIKQKLDSKKE